MIDRAAFLQRLDEQEKRVSFSPGSHRYKLDGKHVPGVTTILKAWDKPALTRWMVRVQQEADIAVAWELLSKAHVSDYPDEGIFCEAFRELAGEEMEHQKQSREAADIGTQMHKLLEHHFRTALEVPSEAPAASDKAQELFSSVLDWLQSGDLEPITMERRVFSVADWYAGTADLFALYRGIPVIADYKSRKNEGGKLWPEQECQSAAYRWAAQEMGLGMFAGLILTIPKDGGSVTPVSVERPMSEAIGAFKACRTLYAYGNGKPKKEAEAA